MWGIRFYIRISNFSLWGCPHGHCVHGAQQIVSAHPLGILPAVQISVYLSNALRTKGPLV